MKNTHGRMLIFTGDGKGKTTAALGMALRAVGHGQRVLILQFIKANSYSGELAVLKNLPEVELLQMGRGFLAPPEDPRFEEHRRAAEEALKKAVEILEAGRHQLIILDEVCTAIKKNLSGPGGGLQKAWAAGSDLQSRSRFSGPLLFDYLTIASGRPCYNLDGWMADPTYLLRLFERTNRDADLAVVEGVMGLFDGADPVTNEGSTAEIARWLQAPVLLVLNAHGMARSIAALVKGYGEFDPKLRVAGVLANHSGTDRHREWICASLATAFLPPLLGAISRGASRPEAVTAFIHHCGAAL
jgi:hypothetical protein